MKSLTRRSRARAAAGLFALALHVLLAAGLLLREPAPLPVSDTAMEVVLVPPPVRERTPPVDPPPRAAASPAPAGPVAPPVLSRPPSPGAAGRWAVAPAGKGEEARETARRTLRAGVGCRNADFLALTETERNACDERLAEGAAEARPYAVVSPKLKKEFDGVFECPKGDVWCEYRIGKAPYPGLLSLGKKRKTDWD